MSRIGQALAYPHMDTDLPVGGRVCAGACAGLNERELFVRCTGGGAGLRSAAPAREGRNVRTSRCSWAGLRVVTLHFVGLRNVKRLAVQPMHLWLVLVHLCLAAREGCWLWDCPLVVFRLRLGGSCKWRSGVRCTLGFPSVSVLGLPTCSCAGLRRHSTRGTPG